MHRRIIVICLLMLFSGSSSLPLDAAGGAEPKPLQVSDFLDFEDVLDSQISPDGTQIVYTRRWVDKLQDRWTSELWIVHRDGTKNRRLVEGSAARWSPDGTRLAFVHDGEGQKPQIFVRWMDAEGAVSQVTRLEQQPANLRWSPDGEQIAFTMLVEDKNKWDIDLPKPPEGAKWTEPPKIIEKTHYRQDQRGFMKEGWVHLFVVTADGGTPRRLTEGDWHVGARPTGLDYGIGVEWTPDGSQIVFDALKVEDADRRYRESHIYAVNVGSGEIRQITKERGPWSSPVVSPDGRLIAFAAVMACAQTGMPPGGPPDREPPEVVRITPDTNAVNVRAGSIGIQFNEVVSERPQGAPTLADLFVVSPSTGPASVSWRRTRVEVTPRFPVAWRKGGDGTIQLVDARGQVGKHAAHPTAALPVLLELPLANRLPHDLGLSPFLVPEPRAYLGLRARCNDELEPVPVRLLVARGDYFHCVARPELVA